MPVQEFRYRIPWRVHGAFPGSHAGRHAGGGFDIDGFVPLLSASDPRRFDVRASMRDPFRQVMVRKYRQPGAVPIRAIADVSASMGFQGHANKWQVLAQFVMSLAYSAHRAGDPFGFTGCDNAIRSDLTFALTRDRGTSVAVGERLLAYGPGGNGSAGLVQAARRLPATRALVFLLSDFHFPIALLNDVLLSLSPHQVVPVIVWDSAEASPPRHGIARVRDPETAALRTVWLRPAFSARLRDAISARQQTLNRCFAKFGCLPLWIDEGFDAHKVTRYFYG